MKTKIAMLLDTLDSGGIEKAAISLLRQLSPDKYEIFLFLHEKKGIFLSMVPSYVNIFAIETNESYKSRVKLGDRKWLIKSIVKGKLGNVISVFKVIYKAFFKSGEAKRLERIAQLSTGINFPSEKFDIVLAYSNLDQLYQAVNCYKSDKIYAWLHTEIDCNRDNLIEYRDLYQKCDKIFGVSEKVVDSFKNLFPDLAYKVLLNQNIIDVDLIKELSSAYAVKRPNSKWWFLTVGRLQMQKGIDIIPDIALNLKQSEINFTWTIIGEGPLKEKLRIKAKEYGLDQNIEILGEKENPYPYFKGCDIYLQPSRYEGYCLTVAEARIFHKPIIATDFAGAREQLENGKCGKIVNFGIESFTQGVKDILNNKKLRDKYTQNLSLQQIDTRVSFKDFQD